MICKLQRYFNMLRDSVTLFIELRWPFNSKLRPTRDRKLSTSRDMDQRNISVRTTKYCVMGPVIWSDRLIVDYS